MNEREFKFFKSLVDVAIKKFSDIIIYDTSKGTYITPYKGKTISIEDLSRGYMRLDVHGFERKTATFCKNEVFRLVNSRGITEVDKDWLVDVVYNLIEGLLEYNESVHSIEFYCGEIVEYTKEVYSDSEVNIKLKGGSSL